MIRFTSKHERIPVVTWVALGAGLMYLLDPTRGNRRRARIQDKIIHLTRVATRGARRAKCDLTNRVHGLGVQLHAKARSEEDVSDEVLVERVRSKMGVFVSHPHAVEVRADSGVVTLRGPILQREARAFVRRAKRMAGVRQLVDQLDRHRTSDHVPALQGGVVRRRRAEVLQRTWAPGVQFLAGTAGIGLLAVGTTKRYRSLAALGIAVLLRASVNMPIRRFLEVARRRVFGRNGKDSPLATATPVGGGSFSPPELTPSEQAEEVARSIRE
jgi:hypothetical protein